MKQEKKKTFEIAFNVRTFQKNKQENGKVSLIPFVSHSVIRICRPLNLHAPKYTNR